MANQALKKKLQLNAETLKWLSQWCIGSHAIYILLRIIVFYSSFSKKLGFLYFLIGVGHVILMSLLYKWAAAQVAIYDKGMSTYIHDLIYILSITLVTSALSDYFMLLLLGVPLITIYQVYSAYSSVAGIASALQPDQDDAQQQGGGGREGKKKSKKTKTGLSASDGVTTRFRGGRRR